jgi:D-arabinose 1-dehydrogenase-like Zn-dependent alcohol dehydrogenase
VLVRDAATETAELDRLARQAENDTLGLQVARVFSAEQAPEAQRLLEAGGVRGRAVLDFTRLP